MKHLIKTVSFIALVSAIPGAYAATSRASVMGKTTSRLPSIAGYINPVLLVSGSGSSSSSDASSLLTNAECIDSYKSCISGSDACGANFEECTTNVLFHAQMPKCLSVLAQCDASGIYDLFGTSSVGSLSDIAEKNTYGEVTRYTYPTDGSVMGQMILGASISNKYDTQQCVRRYTACLKKDNVCGNDFELCTSNSEFKKQAVLCSSTLARCQSDGLIELFGSVNESKTLQPNSNSRLGMMIKEGGELALVNAVSTCYKVADQCILKACGSNPAQCTKDSAVVQVKMIDSIQNGTTSTITEDDTGTITDADVNKYIRNMCQETIGGNRYCYATSEVGHGNMPSASELVDEDNREMVFADIYATRMNSAMKERLRAMLDKFDEKTKDKCVETMKSCAMRSCGGGIGSVCYSLVFGKDSTEKSINGSNTYFDIRTGCEAITNTDPSCKYAAATVNNGAYMYTYTYSDENENTAFRILFPEYAAGAEGDPIGIVATLNASLSTSYNDAAIAQMKKQCANTAISCVKSMCGKDYTNCYRNRTDVMSAVYNTGSEAFDKSMNKVGGVLDYTIVTGLCVSTVKNSKACEEHLKIESYKLNKGEQSETWGSNVRNDWLDAGRGVTVAKTVGSDVTVGCRTNTPNCDPSIIEACDFIDEDGCLYDQKVTEAWEDYVLNQSADNLFRQVLSEVEREAQAKYNAKLTKEQNICVANNKGGIKGANDEGSLFQWVKLKSKRVPKNYETKGLLPSQFTTSNDIYGSFCRAKITLKVDDEKYNKKLGASASAYFAVGDAFTCGFWLPDDVLDAMQKEYVKEQTKGEGVDSWKGKMAMAWTAIGGTALGATAGGLISDALQGGGKLGGLLKNTDGKTQYSDKTNAGSCVNNLDKCVKSGNISACRSGMSDASAANVDVPADWESAIEDAGYCTETEVERDRYSSTAICYGKKVGDSKGRSFVKNQSVFSTVLQRCKDKATQNYNSDRTANVAGGAILGGLVVGGLGTGIAATVLEAKKHKLADKAAQEWIEKMGEKIHCYVGADQIADFGDTVAVNFEEE